MKHLVFAGCSFTHSGDSWAFLSNPFDSVDANGFDIIKKQKNVEMITDITDSNWTMYTLEHQHELYKKFLPQYAAQTEPKAIVRGCKNLSPLHFKTAILGLGGSSNSLISRQVINYLEKSPTPVNSVIFQITGFARRELLTSSQSVIDNTTARNMNDISHINDVTYIKQPGDMVWNIIKDEKDPAPDLFRRSAAKFYTHIYEPQEFYIRALDHLQMLTQYCILNNIKIGYFHGWDNYPDDLSNYAKNKYDRYVRPYLITDENIFSHYSKELHDVPGNDLEIHHGGNIIFGHHPSAHAHRSFWNKVLYPYVTAYA